MSVKNARKVEENIPVTNMPKTTNSEQSRNIVRVDIPTDELVPTVE